MIKIDKDLSNIPSILKSETRKNAFLHNISIKKYEDSSNLYKVGSIDKALCTLYNNKCAYCEKDISDEDKHLEHYRPKDIYYWLAYSWDNLLLSCSKCNKKKGTHFKVNQKIHYSKELFENIHNLGTKYDKYEEPKLINPERENILDKLIFDNEAKINSDDERIIYTIKDVCDLNRKTLSINQKLIIPIKYTEVEREVKTLKKRCPTLREFIKNRENS